MRICLISIVLALGLAAPARAETWLLPRDGATVHASDAVTQEFAIYWGEYGVLPYDFDIEVSSGPLLDADGTLVDADVIARYEAYPRAGFDDIYSARTAVGDAWLATVGSYYWQASYEKEVDALPVHRLDVVPAPPADPPSPRATPVPYVATPPPAPAQPPLPAATARAIVRGAIAAGTHRLARGLVYRCATAPAAATCRPSWRDARYRYLGTLRITAGEHGITAAFSGTRTLGSHARTVTFSASM